MPRTTTPSPSLHEAHRQAAKAMLVPGQGRIAIEHHAGRSVLVGRAAASPLTLISNRPRGLAAWVYAGSLGGGVVGGDQLDLSISVGPGARLALGTPAATKIYPAKSDQHVASRQRLRAQIGTGGLLAVLGEPTCCFAGADHRSSTRFDLAADANLAWLEVLSAGRLARGERWAMGRWQSRTRLCFAGRTVLDDRLLLEGAQMPRQFGSCNALGTVLLCGPLLAPLGQALHDQLAATPLDQQAKLLLAISPLATAPGSAWLLRAAGASVDELDQYLRRLLAPLAALLGGLPWTDRW